VVIIDESMGVSQFLRGCTPGLPPEVYAYRNHKLEISTTPTKAKSREPAYSQALILNKVDRQRVRSRQSDGYGVWSWDGEGGRENRLNQDMIC